MSAVLWEADKIACRYLRDHAQIPNRNNDRNDRKWGLATAADLRVHLHPQLVHLP